DVPRPALTELPARLEQSTLLEPHQDRIERPAREPGRLRDLVSVAVASGIRSELREDRSRLLGVLASPGHGSNTTYVELVPQASLADSVAPWPSASSPCAS